MTAGNEAPSGCFEVHPVPLGDHFNLALDQGGKHPAWANSVASDTGCGSLR